MDLEPQARVTRRVQQPVHRAKVMVKKEGALVKKVKTSGLRSVYTHSPKTRSSSSIMVTPVFIENKKATTHIVVNRGGARSSKSYSLIQLLTERFFTTANRKILIVRKTLPALRVSTLPVVTSYLSQLGLNQYIRTEKQILNFHNHLGSMIHFGSVDDPEKIKSTEWNDIWMEEATEFSYDDYIVLETRMSAPAPAGAPPNQMYLSFNPEDEFHWIKERLLDGVSRDITEIPSNYRHNPFLSQEYIHRLLSLEAQDPNYFRIFALGEWGHLEDLIYKNWDVVSYMPPDEDLDTVIYGLDFGYVHPSALVKVGIKELDCWVQELLYAPQMTNTEIVAKVRELTPLSLSRPTYCDSAEQDRIQELTDAEVYVIGAEKGPGSVKAGIDIVKRYKVHVLAGSSNLLKEIKTYSWRKDARTGKPIEEPIKWNDHALDAFRYALYTYSKQGSMDRILRWV